MDKTNCKYYGVCGCTENCERCIGKAEKYIIDTLEDCGVEFAEG